LICISGKLIKFKLLTINMSEIEFSKFKAQVIDRGYITRDIMEEIERNVS